MNFPLKTFTTLPSIIASFPPAPFLPPRPSHHSSDHCLPAISGSTQHKFNSAQASLSAAISISPPLIPQNPSFIANYFAHWIVHPIFTWKMTQERILVVKND